MLPKISDSQSSHQLLEARDPPLWAAVLSFINNSMQWKQLIQQREIHDHVKQIKKQDDKSTYENGSKMRLQQQTHHISSNPRTSFQPRYQAKAH